MRILEKMGSVWLLDMLAPEVTFRFNGSRGVRSWVGILLTVCYACTVSVLSYITVLTYFSSDSPTVVTDTSEGGKTHYVHLGDNSLLPVMFMTIDEAVYLEPEKAPVFFTLQFSKFKFRNTVGSDGVPKLTFSKFDMQVVPCKTLAINETAFKYYKKYENDELFRTFGMQYGLCVHGLHEELYIQGFGTEADLDMLIFQAFPCSLAAGCAPLSLVKRVNLVSASPIATLNVSNYNKPVKYSMNIDSYYYVNEGLKQKYQPRVISTTLLDDSQSIMNQLKGRELKDHYFSIDKTMLTNNMRGRDSSQVTCTPLEISTLACTTYFQLEYLSTSKEVKIARVYKSMTRTLGEIGGINSFAFILYYYLNRIYCYFAQKKIMVNSVFDFFPEEDEKRKMRQRGPPHAKEQGKDLGKELGGVEGKEGKDQKGSFGLYNKLIGNLDDSSYEKMKKDAYEMIEESIDVVNIAKQMVMMRLITEILLKQYHQKIAPLIGLRIRRGKLNRKSHFNGKTKQNTVLNTRPRSPNLEHGSKGYNDLTSGENMIRCLSIIEGLRSEERGEAANSNQPADIWKTHVDEYYKRELLNENEEGRMDSLNVGEALEIEDIAKMNVRDRMLDSTPGTRYGIENNPDPFDILVDDLESPVHKPNTKTTPKRDIHLPSSPMVVDSSKFKKTKVFSPMNMIKRKLKSGTQPT